MFFKNQVSRRRFILQFAGISGLAMLGARDAYSQAGSRLDWARTSTGIRVVGTVNPVDSAWAFQRSPDVASWMGYSHFNKRAGRTFPAEAYNGPPDRK